MVKRKNNIFCNLAARFFGLTFTLKMMENGENAAEKSCSDVEGILPGVGRVIADEVKHEYALIGQIEKDSVKHMDFMVLAVNNSTHEITWIAVGLTFALGKAFMTGKTALISRATATFAMVA